jgi:hypothetical protein
MRLLPGWLWKPVYPTRWVEFIDIPCQAVHVKERARVVASYNNPSGDHCVDIFRAVVAWMAGLESRVTT